MAKQLPNSEEIEYMKGNKLPPVKERPFPSWMRKKEEEDKPKPRVVRLIEPDKQDKPEKKRIYRKKNCKKTHPYLFED